MKSFIRELGSTDNNQMRLNALAGVKVLADLFSEEEYADIVTLTLDYEGDGFTPVVWIEMVAFDHRFAPSNLQLESIPLDMREWFLQENADHNLLRKLVKDIGISVNEMRAAGPPLVPARRVIDASG